MESSPIRLTQFAHGAGCGCKIAPQVLEKILHSASPQQVPAALLVGNQTNDDAAVYAINDEDCLVSTTDFFMPIVDDAFDFGRIAAANAISDVYAMGGKPLLAIAILGWPVEKLAPELAARVLEGGRHICAEAGIPLAGGHSIDSPEPFFGLSVSGLVKRNHLKQNSTAKQGDLLMLTKPIGVGILSTAHKREQMEAHHYPLMIEQMSKLNRIGELLGGITGVHAVTDITGFGLLGHLVEMAEGSGLSAELYYGKIGVIDGARQYLQQRLVPDATYRNWNSYSTKVQFEKGVNVMEAFSLLPDPQTNGGLLISVHPEALESVQQMMQANGLDAYTTPIGQMNAPAEKLITVKA